MSSTESGCLHPQTVFFTASPTAGGAPLEVWFNPVSDLLGTTESGCLQPQIDVSAEESGCLQLQVLLSTDSGYLQPRSVFDGSAYRRSTPGNLVDSSVCLVRL